MHVFMKMWYQNIPAEEMMDEIWITRQHCKQKKQNKKKPQQFGKSEPRDTVVWSLGKILNLVSSVVEQNWKSPHLTTFAKMRNYNPRLVHLGREVWHLWVLNYVPVVSHFASLGAAGSNREKLIVYWRSSVEGPFPQHVCFQSFRLLCG